MASWLHGATVQRCNGTTVQWNNGVRYEFIMYFAVEPIIKHFRFLFVKLQPCYITKF